MPSEVGTLTVRINSLASLALVKRGMLIDHVLPRISAMSEVS